MDRLTYILDISPASGNKSVPVRLAATVLVEDPCCAAVVAQASFWRLGGGSSRWSAMALGPVSIVCRGRGDRSDPHVSFSRLFLFASLFWSLLEHEVYKKTCSVVDLVRPMMMKRTRRWHWLVFCQRVSLVDLSRQTNRPFASTLNYFFYPMLA